MSFVLGYISHYDPHGVIAQRREKMKYSTYRNGQNM